MSGAVYAPPARADLLDIIDAIADHDEDRPLSFVADLERHVERITEHPLIYRERADIAPGVRSVPHRP